MGRLLVVPTPIGNLEDMTFRAVRALREVSLVLAEDTRRTRHLLTHFDSRARMLAYHQHNKRARVAQALDALVLGDVALVSSAGTPSISDPGFELIQAAVEAGIDVDVLPGASAVITAYVGAALPSPGFAFLGFLPRRRSDRRRKLHDWKTSPYALVLYEAPHRIEPALEDICAELGTRPMVAARELTKVHQEYIRGTTAELLELFRITEPRGEFTLVIAGSETRAADSVEEARRDIARRRARGERSKEAVATVASNYDMPRNTVYSMWIETSQMETGTDPTPVEESDGIIQ